MSISRQKLSEKHSKQTEEAVKILLATPNFNKNCESLRNRFKLPSAKHKKIKDKELEEWHNMQRSGEKRVHDYAVAKSNLLKKYGLDERWDLWLTFYLERNENHIFNLPKMSINRAKSDEILIKIYPDTRQEDFKLPENWKFIEIVQKRMNGYTRRKRLRPNLDKGLYYARRNLKGVRSWDLALNEYSGDNDLKAARVTSKVKKQITRTKKLIRISK